MNNNKRKSKFTLTAIITVVIFAVLLYAIKYPFNFHKLTNNKEFDTSKDFVKFMDVGQADCALIYSNGYCALIDVGLPNTANDLSAQFSDYNISELDVVVISHLHADHVGGLPKIAENFEIENLIMPSLLESSISSAKNGRDIAISGGAKYYDAKQGMNFEIGEFEITVLSDYIDKSNENNRSLFIIAEIGDMKFLFTGDAETKMEKLLLDENLNLDCDVLKVSHHGSDTSSSNEFLNAITPEYAVISVGEDNIYDHPHNSTLSLLESKGAEIYRTDQNGDITFNIENEKIIVTKENN